MRNKPANFSAIYGKNWDQMRPEEKEKILKEEREYNQKLKAVNDLGYYIYKSSSAGSNSVWSWEYKGVKSTYGCNNEPDAVYYILRQIKYENMNKSLKVSIYTILLVSNIAILQFHLMKQLDIYTILIVAILNIIFLLTLIIRLYK